MAKLEPNLTVPRRVLIVEDEANQRAMLTRAVTEAEFEVQSVASAEEALTLLEQEPMSVAILDLNLPRMNGIDLAGHIHRRWPDMQCIILTGYGSLDAAQQAIRLDVVDFLTKPCSLGELEAALGRAWQKCIATSTQPEPVLPQRTPPTPAPSGPIQIHDAERELIIAALHRHQDNRTAAAKELGISVRTLYYRLSRYEAEDHLNET